ncbi:hypothetical protein BT69DRAFT_1281530, partial [Atractiella rhizophila]
PPFHIMAALGHFFLLAVPSSAAPLSWQSHSPPVALHRPSPLHQARSSEVERGPEVERSKAKGKEEVTTGPRWDVGDTHHTLSRRSVRTPSPSLVILCLPRVPMPPSYSLSHPIPSFCCTLACTSWLLSHRRLLHDIEGNNEMADGERGGKVCSVVSGTTSGHLGWSFSCS